MATAASFLIDVDGTPLPDDISPLLTSAYVDSSLRLPDAFMLRFRDPNRIVIEKAKVTIGAKVKITVGSTQTDTPEKLIEGEVTALEAEVGGPGSFTIIRGYDPAHRLFRGRHTQSYTQTTASDAVTQVAQRAKIPAGQIEPSKTVFDHLGQFGQSDWEFLDGMARRIGYELTVRDNKLSFHPRQDANTAPSDDAQKTDPLVLRLGTDLLRFRSVITAAEQVTEVEVRGWDVAQKRKIVSTSPAATKSVDLPTVKPADMAKPFGDPRYVASDTAYRTQSEADTAAAALTEQISSSFAEIDAVARGNPKLRANVGITVDNAGKPFDGKYTITAARHRYDPANGGYTTAFSVTGRQERSLYGLTAGGGRSAAGAGVVIAQVSDANDPTHQGRVKLTFPWLSDDYVSDWARTVQPGAGKNRGAMMIPEVGDEVLVAFEQQDPQRPYVLGGLYNGVDTANAKGATLIDTGSGAVNRRSIISRNGHRIDLLDENGKTEGVTAETGDGKLKLTLDSVGTRITVHSDGTVLIEGRKGIVVDAGNSDLELKGKKISVTATNGVSLSGGSGAVNVETQTALSLQGATIKVAAKATSEFKSGGPNIITGTPVKIN
ncbi:type IV secretion protein Rhs [Mycobacterium dioxanotrophicus]|uniref:Type IV secretion protein Rhs n=1 Tax=Mycobacterium dioxanotrophicus TaxID=482462 RepID=A0A1Y0C6S6_9MYCO|nr:VgrG-related protein [Mycobacterium dioxanotrophicus]ART70766.1 type IV secretion protein Rhs [Mycobacterium dioxanotrophicus]